MAVTRKNFKTKIKVKSTESEVRAAIEEIEKLSSRLFSDVETYEESKIKDPYDTLHGNLMYKGHGKLLWENLDKYNIDPTTLIYKRGLKKYNLLSLAASYNKVDFIEEWARRGLPTSNKEWGVCPLMVAVSNRNVQATKALHDAGADWEEMAFVAMRRKDGIVIKTTPKVIGITQRDSGIASIISKMKVTKEDLEMPCFVNFYGLKVEMGDDIPLSKFMTHLLNDGVDGKDRCVDTWWRSMRQTGVFDLLKEKPYADEINWNGVLSPTAAISMYVALADRAEKRQTEEGDLEACVKSILEAGSGRAYKNTTAIKSLVSAQREAALWAPNGITEKGIKKEFLDKNMLMHPYPATVLRFSKIKKLWKTGLENPVLSALFLDALIRVARNKEKIPYYVGRTLRDFQSQSNEKYMSKLLTSFYESAQKMTPEQEGVYKNLSNTYSSLPMGVLNERMTWSKTNKTAISLAKEDLSPIFKDMLKDIRNEKILEDMTLLKWAVSQDLLTPQTLKEATLKALETPMYYEKSNQKLRELIQQMEHLQLTNTFAPEKAKKRAAL